ncbi:MAG: GPW/gp25 family protein [Solibacillus sp.]
MKQFTITIHPAKVNFFPKTVLEEIFQNVHTIVTTAAGSVPFSRSFGVEAAYIDAPIPVAQAKFIVEIIEKVERFEPRVAVEEVRFVKTALDGEMTPQLLITIRDGVKLQ